jgi:hypothetical protein
MNWHNVLSSLIGAIAGSGLVGVILQSYLSHGFSEDLERLKTTLSAELFERQTRFAWLHNERSKCLVRLYRLLSTADKAFTDMLRPIQQGGAESMKANIQNASKAANAFFDFYDRNRVFFDGELVQQLRRLEEEYRRVWATFVPHADLFPIGTEWAEAWEKLGADVAPLRSQIEQKVQEMLGVGSSALTKSSLAN